MSKGMTMKSAAHRRRAAGFTMVELLIALFLSSVVMLAVYFVFISNTEQYYRQEQIVQMQENMRFALEHLKNDMRNAGRLTVVNGNNANPDPGFCRPTPTCRPSSCSTTSSPGRARTARCRTA